MQHKLNPDSHHDFIKAMADYTRNKHSLFDPGIDIEEYMSADFNCSFQRDSTYWYRVDVFMSDEEITKALFKIGFTT